MGRMKNVALAPANLESEEVAMANSPKLAIAADRAILAPNSGGLCDGW
jgi:hypothetical protein